MKKIPSTKRETAAAFLKKVLCVKRLSCENGPNCQIHKCLYCLDTIGNHIVTSHSFKDTPCTPHILSVLSLQQCKCHRVECCHTVHLCFSGFCLCMLIVHLCLSCAESTRAGQPCTAPVCYSSSHCCHVACCGNLCSGSVINVLLCCFVLPACGLAHIKYIYIWS